MGSIDKVMYRGKLVSPDAHFWEKEVSLPPEYITISDDINWDEVSEDPIVVKCLDAIGRTINEVLIVRTQTGGAPGPRPPDFVVQIFTLEGGHDSG